MHGIASAKLCHILLMNTKTTFGLEIMVTVIIYSKDLIRPNIYNTIAFNVYNEGSLKQM